MTLVRRRIYLDGAGKAVGPGAGDKAAAHVLLLPSTVDVVARTFADLLEISRNCQSSLEDYCLADYAPAYLAKLLADMETAHSEGHAVYLWDAERRLVLVGYPRETDENGPDWSDTQRWYATAQDAFHKIQPTGSD